MGRLRGTLGVARASALLSSALAVVVMACGGGAPSSAGSSGGSPAVAGTPLVGAWTTSITKADLSAAGITDPGLQNENSGRFTWTFAQGGTWTAAQESLDGSPINTPVFRGTYTVDHESLVATTTYPEQYRDSGLHYTFAIEGSSVRFDVLDPPDTILRVIVETHPWTRAP
jgi:hypothetical protein